MRKNYFICLLKVLLIASIIFFLDFRGDNSLTQIDDSNYKILTYREMLKLIGGSCGGSGGPCEGEQATDCEECTAFTIGICRGIVGDCEEDTRQLRCMCDINDYTITVACDY